MLSKNRIMASVITFFSEHTRIHHFFAISFKTNKMPSITSRSVKTGICRQKIVDKKCQSHFQRWQGYRLWKSHLKASFTHKQWNGKWKIRLNRRTTKFLAELQQQNKQSSLDIATSFQISFLLFLKEFFCFRDRVSINTNSLELWKITGWVQNLLCRK